MLKKIEICNFKSFKNITLNLNNFNILVGGNSSGKSNFVDVFRFLRDVARYDLDDAISNHGGVKYIRNLELSDEPLRLKIVAENDFIYTMRKKNKIYMTKFSNIEYSLIVRMKDNECFEIEKFQRKIIRI